MINLKQVLTGGPEGGENPLSEMKSMLTELTRGKVHQKAELDVTKARLVKELESAKLGHIARENLRATPEQKNILANIMRQVEQDFIEIDLKKDLGITDKAQLEQYRALFREYFVTKMSNEMLLEIYASKEWERLNAHVNEVAKYTKLDEIIATCKVEGNTGAWYTFAEKHPMLASLGSWVISWYVGNKEEKNLSKFDKKLIEIGQILSGEDQEKKRGEETGEVEGQAPTEGQKPSVEIKMTDLEANQKAAIKPLTDAGFVIDLNTVAVDIKYLNTQHLDDQKIIEMTTASAKSDANFYKIAKAILTKLGGKTMKFRLTDVYTLQGLSEGQVSTVLKIIEKVDADPTKMREALNRTKNIPKDESSETVIARHMQIQPDVQSMDASPETSQELG